MGNNSSANVYEDAYIAPVAYPVVEASYPPSNPVPKINIPATNPPRTTSKGINIKHHLPIPINNNRVLQQHTYTGEEHGNVPIKIVLLGRESVGKGSFVNRSTKGSPDKSYCATETVFKTMLIRKTNVTFQIVVCLYIYIPLFFTRLIKYSQTMTLHAFLYIISVLSVLIFFKKKKNVNCLVIYNSSYFQRKQNVSYAISLSLLLSPSPLSFFVSISYLFKLSFQMVNDDLYLEEDLFHDTAGVFLMYDMTNRESFHAIESVYLMINFCLRVCGIINSVPFSFFFSFMYLFLFSICTHFPLYFFPISFSIFFSPFFSFMFGRYLPFLRRCCPYSIKKVLIASKGITPFFHLLFFYFLSFSLFLLFCFLFLLFSFYSLPKLLRY